MHTCLIFRLLLLPAACCLAACCPTHVPSNALLESRPCVAQFVDALARDTVTLAAMGKRDMQALEAMGVANLDKEFLGFNRKIKNTKASINNTLDFD